MKKSIIAALLLLSACGYSAKDGELVGQVKKVSHVTPMFCGDYYAVDVSLGVMRNGTGSMSTQDMWFTVANVADIGKLQQFASSGALVKVRYDTRRAAFCTEEEIMTGVEVTQ